MKFCKYFILSAIFIICFVSPVLAHEDRLTIPQNTKIESLLRSLLEKSPGTEVIISQVSLPPNTTLPRHWHPGEEFAYVIQGSLTLFVQDEDDLTLAEGDVAKVPYKRVHTVTTDEHGAVIVVFRVHEEGQPERNLVD